MLCNVDKKMNHTFRRLYMAEVLSQQEIDKLLGAICENEENIEKDVTTNLRKIKIYDFRRPDILRKYQIRDLFDMAEIMTQHLSGVFAQYHAKKECQFHVASVDVLTTEEYYRSLPSPTFLYKFDYADCFGCVDVSPELVLRGFLQRKISYNSCIKIKEFDNFDIEVAKTYVIEPLLKAFRDILQKEVEEVLPQLCNIKYIYRPNEYYYIDSQDAGVLVTMEMKLGEDTGMLDLFLPKKMTDLLIKQEVLEMRKRYVIQDGEAVGNAYVSLGSRTITEEMKKDITIGSIV